MKLKKVAPIILAAGRSTRFGSNKLLAEIEFNGRWQALLLHTLSPWLEVFERICLVTPKENHLIREACHSFEDRIEYIKADDAELGMGHSLAAGVRACQLSKGYLIGLADMPMIETEILLTLVSCLEQGFTIAAPYFEGRRGHPVAFSNIYRDDLMKLSGDSGAKSILIQNEKLIGKVSVKTPSVLTDIDQQSDLSKLTATLS